MKTFQCVTFGCRVNQYETQAIREQLQAAGYSSAPEGTPADLVVVNSCTVTEAADRQCMQTLKRLHAEQPQAKIVVTGCLVQRDADTLKGLPGISLLVGSNQKHRIAQLLKSLPPDSWGVEPRMELELSRVYAPLKISAFNGRSKAFLKVQDGCERACAFCKIPLVRGRSRSRRIPDILEEVRRLVDHGYQEIVLTGVALGLWGREWDPPISLSNLLEEVNRLPGDFRIRLSSLDPRDLDDRLVEALGSSPRLCHHLHLSLQSGSDPVLLRMNRGYTAAWYEGRIQAIRRYWPDLGLTTDWIVGFPGETERHFQESIDFCRRMLFAKVHVFGYSRRQGTSAWYFKGHLPTSTIKARARILRETAQETGREFRQRFLGTLQEVLVEEPSRGYTSQFLPVEFPEASSLIGQLVHLDIVGATAEELRGTFSAFTP